MKRFPSYFSQCSLCISSLLLPYLLFSIILWRLTSFNIFSLEVLRYFTILCFSTVTQSSSPIWHLPPSQLYKCSLSTSALGCSAPYIVISFLVFWSSSLSSISVQLMTPAPYLAMETSLELMEEIIFFQLNLTLVYF